MRETLTLRTVTAVQRLADLERRGKDLPGAKGGVLKTALRELEAALEELRVAGEQLNQLVDEMAEARAAADDAAARFSDFRDVMPIAVLTTDPGGTIAETNIAGGELFNVSPRHLAGKQLSLYMADRDAFFALVSSSRYTRRVHGELLLRPRERKPRPMSVHIARPDGSDDLYWFFQPTQAE